MEAIRRISLVVLLSLAVVLCPVRSARAFDVVLNAQGEFLDAYLVNGEPSPPRVVFIDPDPPEPSNPRSRPRVGRHVNGNLCFFPRGFGHDRQFVIADDTYREACLDRNPPQARCSVTRRNSPLYVGRDPDGWGVFKRNGKWAKGHIHTQWDFSAPDQPQGNIDPQGCAFDSTGRFFGVDVGHGDFTTPDGSLIIFFPGKRKRYDTYCFLDKTLAAPGMPVMDDAGNLYIPEPAGLRVTKVSPPFPTSAADCANPERLVTTPPTRTVFIAGPAVGIVTPAGIARVPGTDHFYIGSVLLPPIINEYDRDGIFVRTIAPPGVPKNPLGMSVGADGTLYYAELNLDPDTRQTRCGSVSRVRFDMAGQPLPPEQLGRTLRFPDGVTVVDSSRLKVDLRKLPPALEIDPSRCGGE